ncbi:MAG: hypothetical protein JWM32_2807 [Verrucomicrobia bacterium]|nr:hypothetical protein [Verrucomicrobiota bacterium]
MKVERRAPFGPLGRFRNHLLRPEEIHPVVRISHRLAGFLAIPPRIIFDHELVLIVTGSGHWTLDGMRRPYAMHDLLFIPPFVPHSFEADDRAAGEHIAVHFDFAPGLPKVSAGLDRRGPYQVRFTHGLSLVAQRRLFSGHRIARALNDIVAVHGSSAVLGPAQASAHLAGVLLALLAEPRQPRPGGAARRDQTRVQAMVEFMAENLSRPLDHRALEKSSGLSPSRLQALFRNVTGYPPLDYLRRLRVEEARRLLADNRLSVKEIAARTGFRDASHFSKVFRRVDGLSPAHYRDALLAGRQEK